MTHLKSLHSWTTEQAPQAETVAIFLHGFGTDEHDLPPLAPRILPEGIPWASLRAPLTTPNGGAEWFPIEQLGSPRPEPILDSAAQIWEWVDALLPVGTRILPIGFSQGGLMVTELLRSAPQRLTAGVILSGFVAPGDRAADTAAAAAHLPVFWGHGDADQVITPTAVQRTATWLPGHSTLEEHLYPGLPHSISPDEITDIAAFIHTHTH